MLSITKRFDFETAHAIHNYNGACRNIHGHSYQLRVTVFSGTEKGDEFISGQGFVIDFKELKAPVKELIDHVFDHKLILSKQYLQAHPELKGEENLVIWDTEPTAENILIYFSKELTNKLPGHVRLKKLQLYETKDSFAELALG